MMKEKEANSMLEAELKRLKEAAAEPTGGLCADERMVARVRAAIAASPRQRQRPRLLYAVAALCFCGMVASGLVLLGSPWPPLAPQASAAPRLAAVSTAPQAISSTGSSYTSSGEVLPYAVAEIGEYAEGYAAALASNGYYGYVDENGLWVRPAIFREAEAVQNGQARVRMMSGESAVILIEDDGAEGAKP
ncbi:MAG: WG repeat-containing protein [Christensenellaceae bacterium]|jgi:hypothetical protein|nr:WG repeat-containing protein [Christensenellaceae bacterium]